MKNYLLCFALLFASLSTYAIEHTDAELEALASDQAQAAADQAKMALNRTELSMLTATAASERKCASEIAMKALSVFKLNSFRVKSTLNETLSNDLRTFDVEAPATDTANWIRTYWLQLTLKTKVQSNGGDQTHADCSIQEVIIHDAYHKKVIFNFKRDPHFTDFVKEVRS